MRNIKRAFTLIEMLVVIGIIALLAAGMSMVSFGGGSQNIYTAQQVLMGAFYEAKTIALTRHASTRVIIYKGKDNSRKLRHIGVLHCVHGEDLGYHGWVSATGGTMLPEGTFFIPPEGDFAKNVKLPPDVKEKEVFKSTFNNGYTGSPSVVGLQEFPSTKPMNLSEGNGDFYSYEISSDGVSMNPGARVMIGLAKQMPDGKFYMESPYAQVGFVIRRLANTIPFTDYDEIVQAFGSGVTKDAENSKKNDEEKSEEGKADKKDTEKSDSESGNAAEQAHSHNHN